MAAIAVFATRSRRSPASCDAVTSEASQPRLSSTFTSVSQTSVIPPASISQSGVNVRTRVTAPPSSRARMRNSVAGSSTIREPRLLRSSPRVIDTPLPRSSWQTPQQSRSPPFPLENVSKQHICRVPAIIGMR